MHLSKKRLPSAPLFALTFLICIRPAVADAPATLKVAGTIRPSGCKLNLAGNGQLDFGTTPARSLSAAGTRLPAKSVEMTIECVSPIKVFLIVNDSRADSKIAYSDVDADRWPAAHAALQDDYVHGLGMAGTGDDAARIGGMMLGLDGGRIVVDGTSRAVIFSPDQGSTWIRQRVLSRYFSPGLWYGWEGDRAVRNVTGQIMVWPTIAKRDALPLTDEIRLNGLITLTLVYP